MADCIAAIATAAGPGGVGIVRISGTDVPGIARQLLGKAPKPRLAHFAHFADEHGQAIDHGLMLYFPAPHSYTGEHVLELQIHGSPIALQMLLKRVCQLGARPARAGEFTERAYLNHKLDLAQAEAVADLITAQSEAAAMAATRSLDGLFSRQVAFVLDQLIETRKYVEALIDFPDEEIDFTHYDNIDKRLQTVLSQLQNLLSKAAAGQRLRDGLYVVIAGPPNAGKSSLLNALSQTDSAIVTPIAGTTRDVLRESITIDGIPVTLVDTAGLRTSDDVVEAEGIKRAKAELDRADLILLLIGADQETQFGDLLATLPNSTSRPVLRVLTKSDLTNSVNDSDVQISSLTGAGLEQLKIALLRVCNIEQRGHDGSFSARARHVHALETVLAHLDLATQWLAAKQSELTAEELRLAQKALGQITGDFSADDLLGQIFSSFCIGK